MAQFDALSAVVEDLRAGDVHHVLVAFSPSWAFCMDTPGELAVHVLLEGGAWLMVEGEDDRWLRPGDLVLLPAGTRHWLSDRRLKGERQAVADIHDQLRGQLQGGPVAGPIGGDDTAARMLCLRGQVARHMAAGFQAMLPRVLHVQGWESPPFWLATGVAFIRQELAAWQPGNNAILSRIADILLIYCLRYWIEVQPASSQGLLAGLGDPALARVLAAIHRAPEARWTVAGMAAEAGLSRAVFANRFRDVLGETPLHYLTGLRMQRAVSLMQDRRNGLANVAQQLGYQSESAFNRAFRRVMGQSPGRYRCQLMDQSGTTTQS